METLQVTKTAGTQVQQVELKGDPRNPEPDAFRVKFPGGDVDIQRCSAGDYWIHIWVNREGVSDYQPGQPHAIITDARLDIHGKNDETADIGDFDHKDLYHLAVRVRTMI